MKRIVCAALVWGVASIAHAAPLTPQQAFEEAKGLAASAQAGAVSDLSNGKVAETINQFNPTYYNSNGTAPESSLFQGGNGDTASAGQAKVADCQNGTPNPDPFLQQNCDAINFMAKNPSNRPQFTIPPELLASSRAIQKQGVGNLGLGVDPGTTGTFTSCVNKTTSPPPTAEICDEWFGTDNQQCTMGREVLVDASTNYQCDKTADTYRQQTCDKTVNAVVTQPAPVGATGNRTLIVSGAWSSRRLGRYARVTCNTSGWSFSYSLDYPASINYGCRIEGCYAYGGSVEWFCPSTFKNTYSCPPNTTLTGTGTSSMCVYPPVATSEINNGCTALEAAAL